MSAQGALELAKGRGLQEEEKGSRQGGGGQRKGYRKGGAGGGGLHLKLQPPGSGEASPTTAARER